MLDFVHWVEMKTDPYNYFMAICDSRNGKFPSALTYSSAMFRYPATERWPTVRKAMFQAVKQFGFQRGDVYSVEAIELDNWTKSKKWTQFDYQQGQFVMINPGLKPKPVKAKKVEKFDLDKFLKDQLQIEIDHLKWVYTNAGHSPSDEQLLQAAKERLRKRGFTDI